MNNRVSQPRALGPGLFGSTIFISHAGQVKH